MNIFGFVLKHEISIGDLIQTAAFVATVATFYLQSRRSQQDRRDADAQAAEARKIQIYQTLEIESNTIFRFEAEHKYILPQFKEHLAPIGLFERTDILDNDGTKVTRDEMQLIARKYYEVTCNLFEVAARMRDKGFADPEVFGSWVAWYFDTVCEWGFRAAWAGLRDNYTPELRGMFDETLEDLVKLWDIPHHNGAEVVPDIEHWRELFYQRTAKRFSTNRKQEAADEALTAPCPPGTECEIIWNWLERASKTAPKVAHPMAYD
jgi:hypothetical protein